jgi:hypothetical protein
VPPSQIGVFGQSLGTGVATALVGGQLARDCEDKKIELVVFEFFVSCRLTLLFDTSPY